MSSQEELERAYREGGLAAESGDLWDEFVHAVGPLASFGLQTEEMRAWDAGFSEQRGEIRFVK